MRRYGGNEAESDSHSTPEDASAHNNLSEDSITSYSAFFCRPGERARGALCNGAFHEHRFAYRKEKPKPTKGMSFTILREGAISHPALLHFADLCLTFVRQIPLFLVSPVALLFF